VMGKKLRSVLRLKREERESPSIQISQTLVLKKEREAVRERKLKTKNDSPKNQDNRRRIEKRTDHQAN